jgi:hypothetical protein
MLGKVLSRQAEEEQRRREVTQAPDASQPDQPQPQHQTSVHPVSTSTAAPNTRASYEEASQSIDYSSSSDSEGSIDDDDDESDIHPADTSNFTKLKKSLRRIASKLRSAVVALADVDNVWDSPDANEFRRRDGVTSYGSIDDYDNICTDRNNPTRASVIYNAVTGTTAPTRNRTAVLFWFLLLSFSYASERSTFKLLVDRVGPFRLFSAELIVGCHAGLLGMIVLVSEEWRRREKSDGGFGLGGSGLPIPLADIGCKLLVGCCLNILCSLIHSRLIVFFLLCFFSDGCT